MPSVAHTCYAAKECTYRPQVSVGYIRVGVLTYAGPRCANLTECKDVVVHHVKILKQLSECESTADRWIEVRTVVDRKSRRPVVTSCNCCKHCVLPVCTELAEYAYKTLATLCVLEVAVSVESVVKRIETWNLEVVSHAVVSNRLRVVGRCAEHQVEVEVAELLVEVGHQVGRQVLVAERVLAQHTFLPSLLVYTAGTDLVSVLSSIRVHTHAVRNPPPVGNVSLH